MTDTTYDRNVLVGYALIALVLSLGHAFASSVTWVDPLEPNSAYTSVTSAFVPGPLSSNMGDRGVERNGMAVYDALPEELLMNEVFADDYTIMPDLHGNALENKLPVAI